MTYDERIYDLVKKKNEIELTEEARELLDKAIEIATEIKADLDDRADVFDDQAKINKYMADTMSHLHEIACLYKSKAILYYKEANKKRTKRNKLYDDMIERGCR